MIELKMKLEGDQEDAFRFVVAKINKKRKVPYDEQEIFRQIAIFYIKRMLRSNLPVKIETEDTTGMTDDQQAKLFSKIILGWDKYVKNNILEDVPERSIFKRVKNWMQLKSNVVK